MSIRYRSSCTLMHQTGAMYYGGVMQYLKKGGLPHIPRQRLPDVSNQIGKKILDYKI